MPGLDWLSGRMFQLVHGHQLVYNTCWEDPRLDREALELRPEDSVLVITSAGCNALDYALAGAGRVVAVDINPRQNALLELKLAGIRGLRFEDFFAMFGEGRLDRAGKVYAQKLRPFLSPWSQSYWDRRIAFFDLGNLRSFYFRGTSGVFALLINFYIDHVARLRPSVDSLLSANSVAAAARDLRRLPARPLLVAPHAIPYEPGCGPIAFGRAPRAAQTGRDAV